MKFKVYHVKNPKFGMEEHPEFNQDNYEKVAELELDIPDTDDESDEVFLGSEKAFNWTQNHMRAWSDNSGVIWHKDGYCRSSTVGDVIVNEADIGCRCEIEDWTILGQVKTF